MFWVLLFTAAVAVVALAMAGTFALHLRCIDVAVPAAIALVTATALQWWLVDLLTEFLLGPFLALFWLWCAACTVWAIVDLIRRRASGWRGAAPLFACTSAWLAVLLVPFTDLWIDANFRLLRERREEVIRQVNAGALHPNDRGLVALGSAGLALSMGGNEIEVEEHDGRQYVLFFTYRGVLDNYSGFLFVPEGGDPRLFSDLGEAGSTQLIPYGGGWYFAGHR